MLTGIVMDLRELYGYYKKPLVLIFFLPFPEDKGFISVSEALPDSTFILFVTDVCIVTNGKKKS